VVVAETPPMSKGGWVYILANRYRGGMYVGVTADLTRRVCQDHEGKWKRDWMFALIKADNPEWHDVWDTWFPADAAQV
jgi:putative endonuclease